MSHRLFRFAAALGSLFAAHGATARAQYGYYPRGYGGAGWGGWGVPLRHQARAWQEAWASTRPVPVCTTSRLPRRRSINANTTMRFNDYMYQSSQVAAKKHGEMLQRTTS